MGGVVGALQRKYECLHVEQQRHIAELAVLCSALGEGLPDGRQLGGVELDGERVETGGFDVECWLHRCDGVVI